MKNKVLGVAAILLFAASALAEDVSIKPGLWNVTLESAEFSALRQQFVEEMAKKSPEERQELEASLDELENKLKNPSEEDEEPHCGMGYLGLAVMRGIKVCIMPEEVSKQLVRLLKPQYDGKCAVNTSPRVGDTIKLSYACTVPPPEGDEIEITFQSDTAFSTTMQGAPDEPTQTSWRWLGADCGDVKSMLPPAQ